ncbi:MAG TPA: nuclear transport factor 2 family protein [Gemmatimonas sp.]|nr:nuclear transport factor 2 family protein [Gemmatimonas sp.]
MSDRPELSLADREAIRDLRARFADLANRRQFDGFSALFSESGRWAIPDMQAQFEGRVAIRGGIEHMLGLWELFVQFVHDGPIDADGETVTGHSYVQELGRFVTGGSQYNCAVYDDVYEREDGVWKFASRTYHFLYVDETPLPGRVIPHPA